MTMVFWIWVILAAFLGVAEILTGGFFLLPFAIGAVVSAIIQLLGGPLWLQIVVFVILSLILVFAFRPFAKRITHDEPQKTGVNRVIDQTASVIETIPAAGQGRILVNREEWNAVANNDGILLEEGSRVKVLSVEGTRVVVEPL